MVLAEVEVDTIEVSCLSLCASIIKVVNTLSLAASFFKCYLSLVDSGCQLYEAYGLNSWERM